MPNRFTRVPERPVPAIPRPGQLLLPVADLFMIVLVSRPKSGSLRTTWVTPATLALCAATAVVGVVLDAAVLSGGMSAQSLIGGAALAVLVVGSTCVATIGLMQRR